MRKILIFSIAGFCALSIIAGCTAGNKVKFGDKESQLPKVRYIVYFSPEIDPDIEEIKSPTYSAFFSAVSNKMHQYSELKMVRVDSPMKYDSIDPNSIKEFCVNNNSQVAVIPKIKYFKVGFGKLTFSNQVVVKLKLYDANGNFIIETTVDTYKGKGRLLGASENSVKVGTKSAIALMVKELTANNAVSIQSKQ